jgi:hypothetical protein
MNSKWLQPFVEEDVRLALSQMHTLKSPGSYGYLVVFYKKSWPAIGQEVCKVVLHFLNGASFDEAINSKNIVLIPKVTSPTTLTKYRPISLCNVLYKFIVKA